MRPVPTSEVPAVAAEALTPMRQKFVILQHVINHIGVAVASKLVPVASIFLYSHYMSIVDYGVLNLAASYLWIFGIIMTLNLHTAVGRYIYAEGGDFARFLGATLLAIAAIFVTCFVIICANLERFEQMLALRNDVILLMLVVVLGSVAESIYTQIAIHGQHSGRLVKVMSVKAVATLAFSVTLLFILEHDKYLAVMVADATVSILFVSFVLYGFKGKVKLAFCMEHLKAMARYSLPLIPYMLCLTLLAQFDRVMIDRFFGKQATGLYSLAYNVGILMLMVVTALLNVFNPAFFDGMNKKDYGRVIRDSDSVFALSVLVTAVLILFGQEIFGLLVPAKYAPALDLIPVVALGGLCFVVFQIWARVIAYANRTYLLSVIGVAATALKIGLNALLLPVYGYKVAAATTVAAYLFMSLACVLVVISSIRLLMVVLLPDLAYIVALAMVMLFFLFVPLDPGLRYGLKLVVLVVLGILLNGKVLGLFALNGRAPQAEQPDAEQS